MAGDCGAGVEWGCQTRADQGVGQQAAPSALHVVAALAVAGDERCGLRGWRPPPGWGGVE
jgi:hypothetical protein